MRSACPLMLVDFDIIAVSHFLYSLSGLISEVCIELKLLKPMAKYVGSCVSR